MFYLRVAVPTDLKESAKGLKLSVQVAGQIKEVIVGEHVKVSLGTKNPTEAKTRFTAASADIGTLWETLRKSSIQPTLRQKFDIARDVYHQFFDAHQSNSNQITNIKNHDHLNSIIEDIDNPENRRSMLEWLVGDFLDRAVSKRGWRINKPDRDDLLDYAALAVRSALSEIEGMIQWEALDYSQREIPRPKGEPAVTELITFKSIIDEEHQRRTRGKGARGVSEKTFTKFRRETQSFVDHRKSDDALTVTDDEIAAWVIHLQDEGNLSNRTIANALTNVRTVWKWGQKQHRKRFPLDDPFSHVERPSYDERPSDERTFTLTEAKAILTAAKSETTPELRWLPWLCSFSGARISELNALTKEDFFAVNSVDFFKLTKSGGRTLKTRSSERRIPVHPTLVKDGFLKFVTQHAGGKLFVARAHENVGTWVRDTVGITREGVGPNHGWRHLFDDLMTVAGIPSDAAHYLAGRATASSRNIYGKSEAMLPGLAQEMAKIPSMLEWNPGKAEQEAASAER